MQFNSSKDSYISQSLDTNIYASESTTHLVDFHIGSSSQHFQVAANLLIQHCEFFKKILGEGTSQLVSTFEFPDVEESTFQLFLDWINKPGNLPSAADEADLTELFELYVLAGRKFLVRDLTLDIVEAVKRFYGETGTYPSLRRVQYIRANTSALDVLRCVLVDMTARNLIVGKEQEMPAHWKKAMSRDGDLGWELLNAARTWSLEDLNVPDCRETTAGRGERHLDCASDQRPTGERRDGLQEAEREWLRGQEDR
jgi:hypothetical protein